MNRIILGEDDVVKALEGGVQEGDTVLIHASLKSIGWFANGPHTVLGALRRVLGVSGTIIMVSASREFSKTGKFDVLGTPADTGLLAETLRKTEGVDRSSMPMVSFIAMGPMKEAFIKPFNSYLDADSPFSALFAMKGKILLLGVGYTKCTLYHLSEERARVPYNFYKTFAGTLIDRDGREVAVSQTYFVRRDLSTKKDATRVGERFEHEYPVHIKKLGNGLVRVFDACAFDAFCDASLRDDPHSFLVQNHA